MTAHFVHKGRRSMHLCGDRPTRGLLNGDDGAALTGANRLAG
ncbi:MULTISPECIES: hypothetical protein [unclassified Mycobacteroides]|nr:MULTISPECIES: hypothetical protein [unclassified Mycobacteroides]